MELTLLANKQTEEFAQLGYTATNVNSGVLHEAGDGGPHINVGGVLDSSGDKKYGLL